MTAEPADFVDLAAAHLGRYELTLVHRRGPHTPAMRLPADVARLLRREALAGHRHEELLGALFVDAEAAPMAYSLPYHGYLDRMPIDSQLLHAPGVVLGAAGLILFHHQPGEDPWLSDRDVEVAELFRDAGEVVGVRLIDYLALGAGDSWISLRHRGWIKLHGLGENVPRPALKPRLRPDDKRRRVKPREQLGLRRPPEARVCTEELCLDNGGRSSRAHLSSDCAPPIRDRADLDRRGLRPESPRQPAVGVSSNILGFRGARHRLRGSFLAVDLDGCLRDGRGGQHAWMRKRMAADPSKLADGEHGLEETLESVLGRLRAPSQSGRSGGA